VKVHSLTVKDEAAAQQHQQPKQLTAHAAAEGSLFDGPKSFEAIMAQKRKRQECIQQQQGTASPTRTLASDSSPTLACDVLSPPPTKSLKRPMPIDASSSPTPTPATPEGSPGAAVRAEASSEECDEETPLPERLAAEEEAGCGPPPPVHVQRGDAPASAEEQVEVMVEETPEKAEKQEAAQEAAAQAPPHSYASEEECTAPLQPSEEAEAEAEAMETECSTAVADEEEAEAGRALSTPVEVKEEDEALVASSSRLLTTSAAGDEAPAAATDDANVQRRTKEEETEAHEAMLRCNEAMEEESEEVQEEEKPSAAAAAAAAKDQRKATAEEERKPLPSTSSHSPTQSSDGGGGPSPAHGRSKFTPRRNNSSSLGGGSSSNTPSRRGPRTPRVGERRSGRVAALEEKEKEERLNPHHHHPQHQHQHHAPEPVRVYAPPSRARLTAALRKQRSAPDGSEELGGSLLRGLAAIDAQDAAEAAAAAAATVAMVAAADEAAEHAVAMEHGLLSRVHFLQQSERQRMEHTHLERTATWDEGGGSGNAKETSFPVASAAASAFATPSPFARPPSRRASLQSQHPTETLSPSASLSTSTADIGDNNAEDGVTQRRRRSSGFAGACGALLRHRVVTKLDGTTRSAADGPLMGFGLPTPSRATLLSHHQAAREALSARHTAEATAVRRMLHWLHNVPNSSPPVAGGLEPSA
jgi:hypothetical protein